MKQTKFQPSHHFIDECCDSKLRYDLPKKLMTYWPDINSQVPDTNLLWYFNATQEGAVSSSADLLFYAHQAAPGNAWLFV